MILLCLLHPDTVLLTLIPIFVNVSIPEGHKHSGTQFWYLNAWAFCLL